MEPREKGITKAASVVGLFTLLSRILGFVRDAVIAAIFGAGLYADAFFVAFRIPNLLRRLVGEGALTVSFIPVFTEELARKGQGRAKELASTAFTLFTIVLLVLTFLGIAFAPWIVGFISPGFADTPMKLSLTISLTRWMFPFLFFISLVALAMGVLNSLKHFTAPALAPALFNISIVLCAVILLPYLDEPVYVLAVGVVIGGIAQLLFQLPFLHRYGMLPRPTLEFTDPAIKRVIALMIPSVFGVAVYQIGIFITTRFASNLAEGSVSYLYYADRVMEFPLGIFGIAIATVVLPSMSEDVANEDWQGFKESISFATRLIIFITLPATVGLIALGIPIINILFQRGEFTQEATRGTAYALYFYSLGLISFSGTRVFASAFYSMKDTFTPVMVAGIALVTNVILALLLMGPLKHGGLALATTLASQLNFILLFLILRRRIGRVGGMAIISSAFKIAIASLFMGIWVYLISLLGEWSTDGVTLEKVIVLTGAIISGAGLFFFVTQILKSPELSFLQGLIKERFETHHENRGNSQ
ncbi:MAG: murein biosynthesis integral membrane protein MurJ [Deltaproteobacteria bacterium]|nr:murein biosynthesis integral membrane protein MurJ [Deltaproteobacteria bacterium]